MLASIVYLQLPNRATASSLLPPFRVYASASHWQILTCNHTKKRILEMWFRLSLPWWGGCDVKLTMRPPSTGGNSGLIAKVWQLWGRKCSQCKRLPFCKCNCALILPILGFPGETDPKDLCVSMSVYVCMHAGTREVGGESEREIESDF